MFQNIMFWQTDTVNTPAGSNWFHMLWSVGTEPLWDVMTFWLVYSCQHSEEHTASSSESSRPTRVDCSILKVEAVRSFETSTTVYQSTQLNFPEDFRLHPHQSDNTKHHVMQINLLYFPTGWQFMKYEYRIQCVVLRFMTQHQITISHLDLSFTHQRLIMNVIHTL
jgi:hypothetical protein